MPKSKSLPNWVKNLRTLMGEQGFNPRSLSLAAGLNATAVRDMLEGRTKFPRYDTARALANALETTPAALMGDETLSNEIKQKGPKFGDDLELLTEVIARLQETVDELRQDADPRRFAAMATTIFRQVRSEGARGKSRLSQIEPRIHDLLDYENLRQKKQRKHG